MNAPLIAILVLYYAHTFVARKFSVLVDIDC